MHSPATVAEVRRLSESGMQPLAIAARLQIVPINTIRRWLRGEGIPGAHPPAPRKPKPPKAPEPPPPPAPTVSRDTRLVLPPAIVADALRAAARAAHESLPERSKSNPRFPEIALYGELRTRFHCASDADRRVVLLRLLDEEGLRISVDRGADL